MTAPAYDLCTLCGDWTDAPRVLLDLGISAVVCRPCAATPRIPSHDMRTSTERAVDAALARLSDQAAGPHFVGHGQPAPPEASKASPAQGRPASVSRGWVA